MATPLTDSINALTTYANEVTGASDTTLSDAVHTLASGYDGRSAESGNIKALITHGGEYINTGLLVDSTMFYAMDAKITTKVSYAHIIGASQGTGDNRVLLQTNSTGEKITIGTWSVGAVPQSNFQPIIGDRFCIVMSGGACNYNGISQNALITADAPLLIFDGYYRGNRETAKIQCEFYCLKIIDNVSLEILHNYVPWLDDNDIACIKDTVTGDLHYNVGTGAFGYIDLYGIEHT